jgi:hypothetical protein
LAAAVIVIWQLYAELAPLRGEVRRLRDELGILSIEDPNRIYVVAVDADMEDRTWKWRVHLPKSRTYKINVATSRIPATGDVTPTSGESRLISMSTKPSS